MTKTCVVCKKQPIPFDSSRSFHMFPKDEYMREKWMSAVQKQKIGVDAAVCSDHFLLNDFHQTLMNPTRRRLLSQAVPHIFLKKGVFDSSAEHSTTHSTSAQERFQEQRTSNYDEGLSSAGRSTTHSTSALENWQEQRTSNVESSESLSGVCTTSYSSDGAKNLIASQTIDSQNSCVEIITLNENSHESTKLEELPCNPKTLKRSSNISDNGEVVSKRQLRFRDGFELGYLFRADFVCDEAWTRFLKFNSIKNTEIRAARRQSHRKELKLKTVQERLQCLKKEKGLSAAEFSESEPNSSCTESETDSEDGFSDENLRPNDEHKSDSPGQALKVASLERIERVLEENELCDEHSIYGEHIANIFRTCNRSSIDITIAQHEIETIVYNLIKGVYGQKAEVAKATATAGTVTEPPTFTKTVTPRTNPQPSTGTILSAAELETLSETSMVIIVPKGPTLSQTDPLS